MVLSSYDMMLIIALMVFVEVLKRRRRSYMVACEDALGGGGGEGNIGSLATTTPMTSEARRIIFARDIKCLLSDN